MLIFADLVHKVKFIAPFFHKLHLILTCVSCHNGFTEIAEGMQL